MLTFAVTSGWALIAPRLHNEGGITLCGAWAA